MCEVQRITVIVRFRAKDEVVLMFNTYSGSMRLYLQAVRESGEVIITLFFITVSSKLFRLL